MFLFPGNSQISMDKKSLKHVRKQYVSLRFLRVSDIGNDFFFVVDLWRTILMTWYNVIDINHRLYFVLCGFIKLICSYV